MYVCIHCLLRQKKIIPIFDVEIVLIFQFRGPIQAQRQTLFFSPEIHQNQSDFLILKGLDTGEQAEISSKRNFDFFF